MCLTGTALLTHHHRVGWLFGIAGQLLWVWYGAVITGTPWNGISAASLIYTAVNVHGWGRWSSAPVPTPDAQPDTA